MKKILVKGNRIKFGPVELRRVKVLDPKAQPKTVTVLIPKKEEGLITTIYQLSEEARIKSGLSSDMWIGPLNDGDVEEHRWQDDFAGYYYFAPTAFDKTHFVFDAEGKPITDKDGLRDGDFAYLTLEMLASNKENNKKGKAVAYSRIIKIEKAEMGESISQEIVSEEAPKGEYQLEKITPQIAAVYLKANTQNRPLKSGLVKFYASEMQAGRWRAAMGAPIIFDWNGVLQDGQHRLQAIVLSGCTVEMYVGRNADPNDFAVIDTGKNRGLGDVLALAGIENYNNISAVIKRYFALSHNMTAIRGDVPTAPSHAAYAGHAILTNKECLGIYRECPELWREATSYGKSFYRKSRRLLMAASVGALYAYLYRVKGNSLDTIKGFFDELAGGTLNNTIILLRNRLVEDANSYGRSRHMSPSYKQKLIAKAWNCYRKGKILKLLRVNPNEEVFFD